MSKEIWVAVDEYVTDHLSPMDEPLEKAIEASTAAGLPSINVAANQGKLLQVLALACGAKRVLEIGTLGGFSTIWLARGLAAGGRLVTLEVDPKHARVATANIAAAGLSDCVEVRVGPALETLPKLSDQKAGPFDLVFIDADKPSIDEYFEWAVRLTRTGGLIIVDNVVQGGALADAKSESAGVKAIRRFIERAGTDPRVSATVIQTVGVKGHDGLAVAVVLGDSAKRPDGTAGKPQP